MTLSAPLRGTTAWVACWSCHASGMQDAMDGPITCSECRGDCMVRARDERGRFTTEAVEA